MIFVLYIEHSLFGFSAPADAPLVDKPTPIVSLILGLKNASLSRNQDFLEALT
jgi:hypothetical protein